jgi:hypothetical protein
MKPLGWLMIAEVVIAVGSLVAWVFLLKWVLGQFGA